VTERPRVAISMGDPTGIGPEVVVEALARPAVRRRLTPILVGDLETLRAAAARQRLDLELAPWERGAPLPRTASAVRETSRLERAQRRPGRPTLAGGRAAYAAIVESVSLIAAGHADALATGPVCKANLAAAGVAESGHTELLQKLANAPAVRMMMIGDRLRVALVTTHVAIARLPRLLSRRAVLDTILLTQATLRDRFGVARPRIAVTGLNPHAGEEGLFGDEERRFIAPAVRDAQRAGVRAEGPLAADSLFPHAAAGRYDAVVCMYHDQGLGPFKLLHFADGVNYTAGLPFVRTSPDHGTAHDIAGQGKADASSMAAALALAARLAKRRPSRARHAA
jgi:4-hydroxythreonine-4-phosphate dehydrogenase